MSGKKVVLFTLAVFVLVLLLGNVLGPIVAPGFKPIRILTDSTPQNGWAAAAIGAYPPPPLYLPLIMKGQALGEPKEPQIKEVGQGGETAEPKN